MCIRDSACAALSCPLGKLDERDDKGQKLVLKLGRPRKPTRNNPAVWNGDADEWRRYWNYCDFDVESERWIAARVPQLSEQEQRLWVLDQKINDRGIPYRSRDGRRSVTHRIGRKRRLTGRVCRTRRRTERPRYRTQRGQAKVETRNAINEDDATRQV